MMRPKVLQILDHMIEVLDGMSPETYDMVITPYKPEEVREALNEAADVLRGKKD